MVPNEGFNERKVRKKAKLSAGKTANFWHDKNNFKSTKSFASFIATPPTVKITFLKWISCYFFLVSVASKVQYRARSRMPYLDRGGYQPVSLILPYILCPWLIYYQHIVPELFTLLLFCLGLKEFHPCHFSTTSCVVMYIKMSIKV